MTQNSQLILEVAAIYNWLDSEIRDYNKPDGLCGACGDCCNFSDFDHLLFVTPPELLYLSAGLNEKFKEMPGGSCPYKISGKCSIYNHRFSGCRIFCCKADKDKQAMLSEASLRKLKQLCEKFNVPYSYRDLKTALNQF